MTTFRVTKMTELILFSSAIDTRYMVCVKYTQSVKNTNIAICNKQETNIKYQ
jgi:hypothetical protein